MTTLEKPLLPIKNEKNPIKERPSNRLLIQVVMRNEMDEILRIQGFKTQQSKLSIKFHLRAFILLTCVLGATF